MILGLPLTAIVLCTVAVAFSLSILQFTGVLGKWLMLTTITPSQPIRQMDFDMKNFTAPTQNQNGTMLTTLEKRHWTFGDGEGALGLVDVQPYDSVSVGWAFNCNNCEFGKLVYTTLKVGQTWEPCPRFKVNVLQITENAASFRVDGSACLVCITQAIYTNNTINWTH